uniref:SH2 domain containing 3C n=1 Tax=Tetraodon nigroviridis TaxID=99883 RepID=H3DH45_TETNG
VYNYGKREKRSFKGLKWFGSLTNLTNKSTTKAALGGGEGLTGAAPGGQPEDQVQPCLRSPGYAHSSEMYTHVGTAPRRSSPLTPEAQHVSQADGCVRKPSNMAASGAKAASPQDLYVPMDPIYEGAHTHKSAPTKSPRGVALKQEPDVLEPTAPEEKSPPFMFFSLTGSADSSGEYVKFSKGKFWLEPLSENLKKQLEEELRLSSTNLKSHAWYHGPIPWEVSESLVVNHGDFLIRDSQSNRGNFVLTSNWQQKTLHFLIRKAALQPGETYPRVQYSLEEEAFESLPALVHFYVGSRAPLTQWSGAQIQRPVNRTMPLSYLETAFGAIIGSPSRHGDALCGQQNTSQTRPLLDCASWDLMTKKSSYSRDKRLQREAPSLRMASILLDKLPKTFLVKPRSELSSDPPKRTTCFQISQLPKKSVETLTGNDEVVRFTCQRKLVPSTLSPRQREDTDKKPLLHFLPKHTKRKTTPSPIIETLSDPDSAKTKELKVPQSGNQTTSSTKTLALRAHGYVERLRVEDQPRTEDGDAYCLPVVEAASSFRPSVYVSALMKENKPLEVGILRRAKELLAEVDPRTAAKHITKADCTVARILDVTPEVQKMMGVGSGMELLTLPHGQRLRLDLLERFHTMATTLAVDVLGCTGTTEERAGLLHKMIQIAAELKSTMGNMFGFAAVMRALELPQISRLEQAWTALRQRHTEGAILYEKTLRPFMKSLNEGRESCSLSNTTFPHVLPLLFLLEKSAAASEGLEPWESVEAGVDVVMFHLGAARTFAQQGGTYCSNAETKLKGFQERPEVTELFLTNFQMRLLWGSRGAEEKQALRYSKFDQVLTALSNKLEPPVRPH